MSQDKNTTGDLLLSELKKQTKLMEYMSRQQDKALPKIRNAAAALAILVVLAILFAVFGFKIIFYR